MKWQNVAWLVAVFILGLASCQRAVDSPKVTPVSGEVFVDGVAAKGATLLFIPMEAPDAGSRTWKLGYPREPSMKKESSRFQPTRPTMVHLPESIESRSCGGRWKKNPIRPPFPCEIN